MKDNGSAPRAHGVMGVCCAAMAWICHGAMAQGSPSALAELSLEELSSIQISSVSRRAERLSDAAASVYVITGEDIRRSGSATLAEALRLAPNLNVARIDTDQYAISARGFNNSIGNKLLVLIDGRTVYTPLFSGVFWDQQDVMLEDIERIEVISGPGATLWGANAVNGVINVITRPAEQTQGMLLSAAAGDRQGAAARYGGRLGSGHYRVYARRSDSGSNARTGTAAPGIDGRDHNQAGFRADWEAGRDQFTVQGDAYSDTGQDPGVAIGASLGRYEASGSNLLGRWTRSLAEDSELRVQAYVDMVKRRDRLLFQPDSTIVDLEGQHSFRWGSHRVVWGGGYRRGRDHVQDGLLSGFRPADSELTWYNVFAQDEFQLTDSVVVTGGLKFEHNDYTGMEHLPNLRVAWKPSAGRLVWAAASRAVRAPSRLDRDITVPLAPAFFLGGPNFQSEVANVTELGYREQTSSSFTYSLTLFHHDWDRLRSGTTLPLILENRIQGTAYGIEGWATWQVTRGWRLSGGLTTLRKHLGLEPGSTDPVGVDNVTLANDPKYEWSLRSAYDFNERHQLDIMVRRVSELTVAAVSPYVAIDARYAWKVRPDTELSLTVKNLADPWHPEFRTSAVAPNEIGRSIFLAVRWTR